MDSRKIVYKETAIVAAGEAMCCAIMLVVFAALDLFSTEVLWSALVGAVVMTVNYFFMAVTVCQSADRAEQGQVKQAKNMVQISSVVRLVVMGVILLACIRMGANVVALLLPLVFVRPILMIGEFFRKKGD